MEKTPKNHGELYFEPDMMSWKNAVARNRERFLDLPLWNQTASKVRASLKLPIDRPVIMTGHQPVFFHPGLWVKCLAASQLAQMVSGLAYHKVTNTALAPEYVHSIPEFDSKGRARRRELDFFTSKDQKKEEKSTPYAFLPSPDPIFFQKVLSDASAFGPPSVKEAVPQYSENLMNGFKVNRSWDQFHLYTLGLLDEITGTKRLYLEGTSLWESDAFIQFAIYWMVHMMELAAIYNEALNEYREKEGITHALEPMGNLRFEDWHLETPFWISAGGHHRDTLWAKIDHRTLTLRARGGEGSYSFHVDDLFNEIKNSTIKIWPKALTQTLFCRMYLCDFFIHGLGGGVYERVGDLLFQKVFKLDPPAFGVVSATYFVDTKLSEEFGNFSNYEKMIQAWPRALEQNPEYLFTRQEEWRKGLPASMHPAFQTCFDNPELQKLAQEKAALVADMKDPAKKVAAGQKLKPLNQKLYSAYGDILKALEQGAQELTALKETKDVLAFREYPFFCYDPKVFLDMKEKIKREIREENDPTHPANRNTSW